jgi:hypothetical protein
MYAFIARLMNIVIPPAGDYDFIEGARLQWIVAPVGKPKEPARRPSLLRAGRRYEMDREGPGRLPSAARVQVGRLEAANVYWARTRCRMRRKSVRRFGPAPA